VPDEVGRHYDEYAALCDVTVGENLHFGYWDTPDSEASFDEAANRLTEVLIGPAPVGQGQRVLDLGCGHGGPAIAVAERTGAGVTGISSARSRWPRHGPRAAAGVAGQAEFQYANAMNLPLPPAPSTRCWPSSRSSTCPTASTCSPGVQGPAAGRAGGADGLLRAGPIPPEKLVPVQRFCGTSCSRSSSPATYVPMLERAGLRFVELLDISPQSVRPTFVHMAEKLGGARREALGTEFGRTWWTSSARLTWWTSTSRPPHRRRGTAGIKESVYSPGMTPEELNDSRWNFAE